ncbi:MAG: hypothetical protein AB7E80_12040 [Hyphomicrobiaceae bacterium]
MTVARNAAGDTNSPPVALPTLAWALRRALIGLIILFVMFGGGAWLLHASIEADKADATEIAQPATTGNTSLAHRP